MIRINRYRVDDRVYQKMFSLLYEVVGKRKDFSEFNQVIFDLLSQAERIAISKRILLIYLIMKKIDYLTICEVMKVSNSTVAKYRLLCEQSKGIVPLMKKMLGREEIADYLCQLILAIVPPGAYGTNWKSSWELKKAVEWKKTTGI